MEKIIKNLIGWFWGYRIFFVTTKKIKKIKASIYKTKSLNTDLPYDLVKKYKNYWSGFGRNISPDWLKVYVSVSGIFDYRFIPENIYYSEIEPRLNFKPYSKAWTDKSLYHKFLDRSLLPAVFLRNINGIVLNEDYQPLDQTELNKLSEELRNQELIIKPTIDTGGGKAVAKVSWENGNIKITPAIGNIELLADLMNFYRRNFILQEYIQQHEFFGQFNETSLNTIRIFTYRSVTDNKIKILHKILRIGRNGNIVDNQASGGIACGINIAGILNEYGVDKYGTKYYYSNSIKFSEINEVPFLNQITDKAIEVAGEYYYSRLLGLDFCVDHAGRVYLIEVNCLNNEINFYQMNNGPLFGEYAREIKEYCTKNKKTILLDFEV